MIIQIVIEIIPNIIVIILDILVNNSNSAKNSHRRRGGSRRARHPRRACSGLRCVALGWALGCTGLCWAVLGCAVLCWAVLGSSGLCWPLLAPAVPRRSGRAAAPPRCGRASE